MIGAEPMSMVAAFFALLSYVTPDPASATLLLAAFTVATAAFLARKSYRPAMFVPCLFVWYTVVVHYRPALNIF
jgi:hypothetical protein